MTAARLNLDPVSPDAAALARVADVLARGGLIAYPTDTFYGLGVDPRQAAAVESIFAAKGRASEQAIPLIASDVDQVARWFGALSPAAVRLAARFWPGPLTLIIPLPPAIPFTGAALPDVLTGGGDSVAIRVPDHPVARAIAAAAGGVITSTSANRSGHPPLQRADDVWREMGEWLALLVDAGVTPGGAPSTIVDIRRDEAPVLVRAGLVPWNRVLESLQ